MKKKVLFINPPTGVFIRDDRCQSSVEDFLVSVPRPPHELLIMATVLENNGHTVMIRDYPITKGTFEDFKRDLYSWQPDVLVINATIPTLASDVLCARLTKEHCVRTTVVVRCGMVDQIAEEVMQAELDIDFIIYGESDFTVDQLLATDNIDDIGGVYYRKGDVIIRTSARPTLNNLDLLPLVNRDLIANEVYIRPDNGRPLGLIEVSRGCPYSCIFCLVPTTYGHIHRRRSVKSVVKEIEVCIQKYGINDFHFKSDLFSCDHTWVHELCDAIIAKGFKIRWFANSRVDSVNESLLRHMKDSGCFALSFGVESGSPVILERMHKKITVENIINTFALCKKIKIETYAYFIMGFPWDTEETIQESITLCKKIAPDFVDFFFPYVLYGTELYRICKEMNLISDLTYEQLQKHSYVEVQFPTIALSQERLLHLRKKAMREFYLRIPYVVSRLKRCKTVNELFTIMRFGFTTLMKLVK